MGKTVARGSRDDVLRPRDIHAALLLTLGARNVEVARELRVHVVTVSKWKRRPQVKQLMDAFALQLGRQAIDEAARRLAGVAVVAAAPGVTGAKVPGQAHYAKAAALIATVVANANAKAHRGARRNRGTVEHAPGPCDSLDEEE